MNRANSPPQSERFVSTARAILEYGIVAVGVDDAFEIRVKQVYSLVPADALELPLASFSNALHRVNDSIGVVDVLSHRSAAQTCTHFVIAEFIAPGVVGLNIGYDAINHMELLRACAYSAACAGVPYNLFFRLVFP